jgi:hypothetical protein
MNRKTLLVVLTIALAAVVSACSSPSPTITITTPPPASLEINGSASIAATTTHDSGEGVDWTCAPAGSCGTLNPTHTASGASTVYTAPSVSGTVTITATSTKKSTVTATATVTINPVATVGDLTGTYTFYANGWDSGGFPYSVAGSVALDGSGNVTGGEQDFFDVSTGTVISDDPIVAGTGVVTVGDDGRGSITITPTTAAAETFSFAVVNNNHALIEEFDSIATSAGSLDLQTAPTSVPAGGNAFSVHDVEDLFVFGGVLSSDGTSTFTTGQADDDQAGTVNFGFTTSGTFTAPDAAGRGTLTLDDATFGNLQFAYYVVGPEAFRLVEIDAVEFAAGSMYGQGSATPNFSAASLTGSFVFSQAGETALGFGFFSAAGQFTTDGVSAFTAGVADANLGDGAPVLAGDLTAGTTYGVNANGYGAVTLTGTTTDGLANFGVYLVDPALNVVDPNNTAGGGSALMINLDGGSLGNGIVVPQVAGAVSPGNLAFYQDGEYDAGTGFFPFDLVGQVLSDGTSQFSGLADYNDLFNTGLNPAVSFSGTITPDSANPGRATVVSTLNGSATPNNLTVYQASSSLGLFVETDTSASGVGTVSSGAIEAQQ